LLDTTVVADGMHTLAWSVTDSKRPPSRASAAASSSCFNGDSSRATNGHNGRTRNRVAPTL
jgi:hypothetical protein